MSKELLERIDNYLGNGGFFNPEVMRHDKVRDLIMDITNRVEETRQRRNHPITTSTTRMTMNKALMTAKKYNRFVNAEQQLSDAIIRSAEFYNECVAPIPPHLGMKLWSTKYDEFEVIYEGVKVSSNVHHGSRYDTEFFVSRDMLMDDTWKQATYARAVLKLQRAKKRSNLAMKGTTTLAEHARQLRQAGMRAGEMNVIMYGRQGGKSIAQEAFYFMPKHEYMACDGLLPVKSATSEHRQTTVMPTATDQAIRRAELTDRIIAVERSIFTYEKLARATEHSLFYLGYMRKIDHALNEVSALRQELVDLDAQSPVKPRASKSFGQVILERLDAIAAEKAKAEHPYFRVGS